MCDVGNALEFGDAVFWQTPLQEVYLPDDESPDLDTNKCGESLGGSAIGDDQMIDTEEECSDSNHPEESANISSNHGFGRVLIDRRDVSGT